jgi:hypothetical protein
MSELGEKAAPPPKSNWSLRVLKVLVALWATVCVLWFTSDRADFPLPSPLIRTIVNQAPLPSHGDFFDLYREGSGGSLLRTYVSLFSPATWRGFSIDWGNVHAFGQVQGVAAILLYTLLGLAALGALGIRWPWPTRIAVAYALGVGLAGWIFEQWAIAFLLNRWTVLVSLILLAIPLCWLWAARARAQRATEIGEPDFGAPHPKATLDFLFRLTVWALLVLLVGLSFLHAVAYPPTNWDGLILYLGYARKTHEAGGFPIKVCAQVGIGLGANYPHLFEVTQAAVTRLFGRWTPLVGQWAVPWAALGATVTVFALAHRIFRRRDLALTTALIFRCYPYGIAHWQLASNYPLAVLFTGAVLLAAYDWLTTGQRRYAVLLLLLTAFASHINYVMPALWAVSLAALLLRWLWERGHPPEVLPDRPAPRRPWAGVLAVTLIAVALAGSWYVRNVIVTGNPVYAFFPGIFDGRNIDPEVLASAQHEWMMNGDGIGRLTYGTAHHTALGNLLALPSYLFIVPVFRWKLAPLFEGLTLPGLLLLLGGIGLWRRWAAVESAERLMWWLLALAVFLGLWAYHIAVADYYLYQILPMLVPAALLAALPLALGGLCGVRLVALSHPFPDQEIFYRAAFPGDVPIWNELAAHWRGARLLTHDNRHLIYDQIPVETVHLDDCDVQPIYRVTDPAARLAFWRRLGVDLYLRVPNEAKHVVTARADVQALIDRGDLRLILNSGPNQLYAFPWAEPRENDVATRGQSP